jgi:ubiquinone/menaquinone biosynthesis C-methylase UbiE
MIQNAPADALKNAAALCQQARSFIQSGDLDKADDCLRQALALGETAEIHHYTGVVLYLRGDRAGAIQSLQAALALDPSYHRSLGNLAALAVEANDNRSALQYIALAVKADPSNIGYKNSFVSIIYQANVLVFSPQLKEVIGLCLESDEIFHTHLFVTWFSLLRSDPDFKAVYGLFEQKDYASFLRQIKKLPDPKAILDPFFVRGVKRLTLVDMELERFMTHLRRFLLEDIGKAPEVWHSPDFEALWCALAEYCFHVEYIFDFTPEERKHIDALKASVGKMTARDAGTHRHEIFALACYLPLSALDNAEALAKGLAPLSPAARELARIQLDEPLEERRIRQTIRTLTPIDDEISKAVRGQYESFPYPRWKTMSAAMPYDEDIGGLPEGADILVAGCGTGQEAIINAATFPSARVLAVDLSLSSLSYAMRKAREMKFANITFGQADLLELKQLNRKFDLISTTGVLTCVKDPPAAWAGLVELLKPSGLMRVGLYSRTARHALIEAQEIIAARKYPLDAVGMRLFRKDAPRLLKKETMKALEGMRDYYSMSECRDLLFHVLEIRHDIPEIEALLDQLGLKFIKFSVGDKISEQYRAAFPDDPRGSSLCNWHTFEQANPDTFIEMYHIWCRKIG